MLLVRALLVLLVSDESLRSSTHAELTDPVKSVGEMTTVNITGFSLTDPTYTKVTMRKETAGSSGEATSSDTTTVAMMQTSDKATTHHTPISDTETLKQTISAGLDSATPPTMTTKQQEPSAMYMTVNYVLPTPPPLKVRKLNAFDTASYFFRDFPSQVVASESEYCGKTCHFKYKNKRTSVRPSCETCRCDGDCVLYGDCCPDYVLLGNQTTVAAPYSCENTSPDFHEQTSDWYYMIRSCPDTTTPGLVQECLDRHSKDWEHQVPVEDVKTGNLYRNKFCALCNNVTLFNHWDAQIKCSPYPSGLKEAKSPEDVYNIALAYKCTIKFLPIGGKVARMCKRREESVISSCNVTGQWEVYDRRVTEACERFAHIVNGKYRNVFCYLCNTNDDWRYILNEYMLLPTVVDSVALTSLLDFRQKTLEVFEPRKGGCGRKQVYDNIIEACRNITCSKGKVFNGTTCNDVVQASNIYGLEICLHVRLDIPSRLVSKDGLDSLTFFIEQMVSGIQWALNDYSWLKTEQLLYHLQNCDNHPRFMIVHIQTKMFSTRPANLDNLLNSLPDILTKYISDQKYENVSLTLNQKCASIFLPTVHCFDERFTGNRMYHAPLSHAAAYLSPLIEYIPWNHQVLCPQVNLQPEEFFLELDDDKQNVTSLLFPNVSLYSPLPATTVDPYVQEFYILRINGTDNVLKSDMFLLGDNGTAVVCLEDYQKIVKRAQVVTDENIDWHLGRTSVICTCVSLIFLIITFIFYCVFPTLRTSGGVINMCLVVTLFFALCVYGFGIEQNENGTLCVFIGILIHFLWLSVLCWMNACTTHMFLKLSFPLRWRLTQSLERTVLFSSLFSFLTPLAIVSLNVIVHYSLGRESGYGGKVCYMNTVEGRLYSFGVPVAMVFLVNIFLFVFTMCKLKRQLVSVKKNTNSKLNMVACVKLSTITGISWLFGYLYELTQTKAFAYVFTILVAGQGLFLFLAFIVNKKTLGLVCSKKRDSSKYISSSNSNNNDKTVPLSTQTSRF